MRRRRLVFRWVFALSTGMWATGCTPDPQAPTAREYSAMRHEMIRTIEQEAAQTASYTGKPRFDPEVMAAMDRVPRHEFVPEAERAYAYDNRPLPIGEGQTISQPYIVALMTDMLDLDPDAVVLEVGTGSGYQAAVLAQLAQQVYSIEIVEPLGLEARARLRRLGFGNVSVHIGDGYAGWPEHAPFDAVIVTAAAPQIPQPLIDQLKNGGRMAIPVGEAWLTPQLLLLSKDLHGKVTTRPILPVAFVPMTGDH